MKMLYSYVSRISGLCTTCYNVVYFRWILQTKIANMTSCKGVVYRKTKKLHTEKCTGVFPPLHLKYKA